MKRYRKPDIYRCPNCGDEISGTDRLYFYDGQWMCEDDIRRVLGLNPIAVGAEFTLSDICDALKIQEQPATEVIEDMMRRFRGEGDLL